MSPANNYELLDSGNGSKLERFGQKLIIRPSSLCIWARRQPQSTWTRADAEYHPGGGWSIKGGAFEEWDISIAGCALRLRLQENGQIGFFPEHSSYLPSLMDALNHSQQRRENVPKVLNLFAYTGLASVLAAKHAAHVTHVDISKRALDWASINFQLNAIPETSRRIIREDAADFIEREARRSNSYDMIICDPPSFSRLSGKKSWQLEDILPRMVGSLAKLLSMDGGSIFFTSHHAELGGAVTANLFYDSFKDRSPKIETRQLSIAEHDSPRAIPAGTLVYLTC